jgi:tRNA A58 N-methylase Trm61
MRVFEYGSGGSTVFFANLVQEVISVEHDRGWYQKLQEELKKLDIDNCTVHHRPPSPTETGASGDPADPDDYVSGNVSYEGMTFRDYTVQIDEYPDEHFDLIVVDGRARPSCFKHAVPKIKNTGMLVWDNTNRSRYHPAMKLAPESFEYLRCPGPTPFLGHFTETSLWKG